jgi:hypothetical protein
MAMNRAQLQDVLNRIGQELPGWVAEHGAGGDLCGAIAGIAEDAIDCGISAEDDAWFHDRLRDLCLHYGIPEIEV